MTVRAVRDRFSTTESSAGQAGDAPGDPAAEAGLPFAGYDRLDARQVIDGLHDRSQIELEAVESYERSHQDREPVLDKLRYMRGSEPLPGYDALSLANRPASAPAYQPISATSGPMRDGEPTE
jgi:hypothetical protein